MPQPGRNDPGTTRASIFLDLNTVSKSRRDFSWQRFDRLYSPFIRGYALSLGMRGDSLDEVVQRVMVGFFSACPSFVYEPGRGRFRGYLAFSVRRAVGRMWMEQGRMQVLEEYDASAAEDDRSMEAWARVAMTRAIESAASSFERRTFEAFDLARRRVPVAEIARQLGMTPDGVYQSSSRVERRVREIYARIIASDTLEPDIEPTDGGAHG